MRLPAVNVDADQQVIHQELKPGQPVQSPGLGLGLRIVSWSALAVVS
jgi:hypothetical protein